MTKTNVAVFLVWLFHISALIGISFGHFDWFISKTPINLIVIGSLVIITFPIDTQKKLLTSLLFFITGMAVEWVGVHHDFLFGAYAYGAKLGPKIDGVPWLIGVNWMVLTLVTAAISNRLFKHDTLRIISGASLMVFLDLFIERAAPMLDFWTFSQGDPPWNNYLSWFIISAFLHYVYCRSKLNGDLTFSIHVYLAQLIFFTYFYGFYPI